MCRLAAFVNLGKPLSGQTLTKTKKALKHIFYINSFNNVDGSGFMWMKKNKKGKHECYYHKDIDASPEVIEKPQFESLMDDVATASFIGMHTRYATVGDLTPKNSHPFLRDHILGMQNGTASCDHNNLVDNKVFDGEVDSDAVFWSIQNQGAKKTFEKYEGAGVFMWIDTNKLTFNIVKNHERTLNRAKIVGTDAYIYATQKTALQLVIDASGLTTDPIEPVPNDTLFTFDTNGNVHEQVMEVKESYSSSNWGRCSASAIYGYVYDAWGYPSKKTQSSGKTSGSTQSLSMKSTTNHSPSKKTKKSIATAQSAHQLSTKNKKHTSKTHGTRKSSVKTALTSR